MLGSSYCRLSSVSGYCRLSSVRFWFWLVAVWVWYGEGATPECQPICFALNTQLRHDFAGCFPLASSYAEHVLHDQFAGVYTQGNRFNSCNKVLGLVSVIMLC